MISLLKVKYHLPQIKEERVERREEWRRKEGRKGKKVEERERGKKREGGKKGERGRMILLTCQMFLLNSSDIFCFFL